MSTLRTVADAVGLRARVDDGARRAVVLGAGYIGLEAAEAFHHAGLEVDVVEMAAHVLPPLERELAHLLDAELRRLGIRVHAGIAAERIEPGAEEDVVVLADGSRVPADVIVLSVGSAPTPPSRWTRAWRTNGAPSSWTTAVAPASRESGPQGMRP